MYYNTTNEDPQTVLQFTKITAKQDKEVLEICKELKVFSPSKVWKKYLHKHIGKPIPITSARRSINTLEKYGYIKRTGNKVKGLYKRNELEYKIL